MALKIETNNSATAFHILHGATLFPYAIDAQMAIGQHPLEWSDMPWTEERAAKARQQLNERNRELNLPPLPEPAPLSPEDQAAVDEHNKAVAAAAERLAEYRAKKAEEKALADQAAADEALLASPPPRPDPNVRRPFGRKGEPTAAELEQIKRRDAGKAAAAEKAEADRIGNAINRTT